MSLSSYFASWKTTLVADFSKVDYSAIKLQMNNFISGAIVAVENIAGMTGEAKKALVMQEAQAALALTIASIPGVTTAEATLIMTEVGPVIMGCLSSDIDMLCNYLTTPVATPVVTPVATPAVTPVATPAVGVVTTPAVGVVAK